MIKVPDELPPGFVPLMEGCAAAQEDYFAARARVCRGEIRGARAAGRWYVDLPDLLRWKTERARALAAAAEPA